MPRRARAGRGHGEQALDLRDGQRDHPGIDRGRLAGPDWRRRLGIGAVPQQGSGDGAGRQRCHDQDSMASDRDVEPDLGLVQAKAVLAKFEIFFNRPLLMPVK
jgi:hypothetical protein